MAELLKRKYLLIHELDVIMDNEDRHLCVSADDQGFHMFFCRTGQKSSNEEREMITLSINEARNLYHCINRVVDWDEEFEADCG